MQRPQFSLLNAEEARDALRDGIAKVTALVPYLKAEIGPVTCAMGYVLVPWCG